MNYVILMFGSATVVAGAVILVSPEAVFNILRDKLDSLGLHVLAVVVRLLIGFALITYADESRFPLTLQVLGWLSIAAAVALGVIGRNNFRKLMGWAVSLSSAYGQFGGLITLLFGGFLVYAVSGG
jgi:uncharacterized BrkB/YihY/UPF0761 family membrane protein